MKDSDNNFPDGDASLDRNSGGMAHNGALSWLPRQPESLRRGWQTIKRVLGTASPVKLVDVDKAKWSY